MTSIRDRLLIGIRQLPKNNQPNDLRLLVGSDAHNIVHVLYGLKREGLVAFREKKEGTLQMPVNIHLTKRGQTAVRKAK